MSRMTLDERVEWVRSNTTLLVSVADDPFSNLWWANTEAVDHPLQFYAFCVEWRDKGRPQERGEAVVSTLPGSNHGSGNGLPPYPPHFPDRPGGPAVNLAG